MKDNDKNGPVSRRRFLTFSGIGTTALAVGLLSRCGGKTGSGPGDDTLVPPVDVEDDGFIGVDTPGGDTPGVDTPGADTDAVGIDTEALCPVMPDYVDDREVKVGVESTTICPYCGCGCGLVATAVDGKITNTEGDPDHPINEGALCSKGQAVYQVANNERRLDKVLHRAPGAADWEEVTWVEAMDAIAAKVKATRDATFIEEDGMGLTVNRTDGIGLLGSAALDNEECYALSKLARAMGLVYIEHQARI